MAVTMEPRTYIPNNRRNFDPNTVTRMQQDLSGSPHQEDYLRLNGNAPMIRRAVGRIPHVCVVGAGVAGLRCADILLQHGVKVTILEGRDRVGGRLCQSNALGHMVDLGPNWIHGTESNPILDLAKETNTVTMNWDGRQCIFDHTGKRISDKEAAENTELVWSIIEQAMKYSNDHSADIPADRSLYNFFEEKVVEIFPSLVENDEEAKRKRQAILVEAEMWGAFVGSPIQTQSLKFFWLEECIDGENLFVAGTYHKVLQRIAEPALKGADIKFKTKVTKIESREGDQDPSVTIRTDGGDDLMFDEVIMTAPLGWLKRNNDAFVPELPNRLKQAIDSIGYGHLDKVYITFPTSFWEESPSTSNNIPPLQHHESTPNVTATTAPVHQGSPIAVNPAHYPGFTHWTSPQYATLTNPQHWNQEAVNLAACLGDTAHPTLLFYTFGPTSLHIASLLKSFASPFDAAAQKLLTSFFEPYYSRLPNYDAANPSHKPKTLLATVWANDELAGYGSYCNFQTGLERGDHDIKVMRRGLPERGVWFAGEHTAPFVALGTVTGAWWAGEGVARRILRGYGLGNENGGGKDGAMNGVSSQASL